MRMCSLCGAVEDPKVVPGPTCVQAEGHKFVEVKGEAVHHPKHYGGGDNPYEVIKVIDAWQLGFCLGNTVKYIARAGKKDPKAELEDLRKSLWYLQHQIELLEKGNGK